MRLWLTRIVTIPLLVSGCQTSLQWTDFAFSIGQHTLTSAASPSAVNTCVDLTLSQTGTDGVTPLPYLEPVTVDLVATKNGSPVVGTFFDAPGCGSTIVTQMTFAIGVSTHTISFLSTVAGPLSLRATATDWSAPALVQTQTPDAPDTGQSTLSVVAVGGTLIANGTDQAHISGYIRDQYGNGIPGAVTLSVAPGTGSTLTPSSITADADGAYSTYMTVSLGNFGTQTISVATPVTVGPSIITFTDYPPVLASLTVTNTSPTNTTTYAFTISGQSGSYDDYCILENNTDPMSCIWLTGPLPANYVVGGAQNSKVLSVWLRNASLAVSTRVDSNAVVLDTVFPSPISSLTLVSPAWGTANDPNPVVRVHGVEPTATVRLFTDNTCAMPGLKGSGIASGTTIDITSTTLTDGAYSFYAEVVDTAGNSSGCSGMSLNYEHDGQTPDLASAAIVNSSPTDINPVTMNYGATTGGPYTEHCILENNTNPASCVWGTGGLPGLHTITTPNVPVTLSVWIRDNAHNTSVRRDTNAVTWDTIFPIAATTLSWVQTSPQATLSVTAQWAKSVSTDLADQVIQYYSDGSCGATSGVAASIGSTALNNAFVAPADGTYTYMVRSLDAAGNETDSGCSSPMVISTTGPALGSLTIDNPNPTNDDMMALTWGTTAGTYSEYCLRENNPSNVGCTWMPTPFPATITALTQGSVTYYAWLRDGALVGAMTASNTVVLDTIAPPIATGVTMQNPMASVGNNLAPTVRVSGVANTDIVYIYDSDATCTTPMNWSTMAMGPTVDFFLGGLTAGAHTFYAQVFDAAGNPSGCSTANTSYFLDTTNPTEPTSLVLQNPVTSPGNINTPTFRVFGVTAGDTISLHTDAACSGGALVDSDVALGSTIDLTTSPQKTGAYMFYAKARDPAGNESTCSANFDVYEYDSVAPTMTSVAITNSTPSTTTTLALTWNVTGPFSHYCININDPAVGNCAWQANSLVPGSVTGVQGNNQLYTWLRDAAGNVSGGATSNTVFVDSIAPAAPGSISLYDPVVSPGSDSTPTIRGLGFMMGETVKLYTNSICTTLVGSGTAAGSAGDAAPSTALTAGTYTFYMTATDAVGNESACSSSGITYQYLPVVTNILVFDDGASYDFGNRAGGTNTDKILYVTNTSAVDDLTITNASFYNTGDVTFKMAPFPGVGGTCAFGVIPKQSTCAIVVRFFAGGLLSGAYLELTYDYPSNVGVTTSIGFTGQAIGGASFAITDYNPTYYANFGIPADPAVFNFKSVGDGMPYEHTFYLQNRGNSAGSITGGSFTYLSTIGYTHTGGTCAENLVMQPNDYCSVKVTWNANWGSANSSAFMRIYTNTGTNQRDMQGTIVGNPVATSALRINDHRIDTHVGVSIGGAFEMGSTGSPIEHFFFVQNTGNTAHVFGGGWTPTISGGTFVQTPGVVYDGTMPVPGDDRYEDLYFCGGTLPAGGACVVAVTFDPTLGGMGVQTGSVTVGPITRNVQAIRIFTGLLTVKHLKQNGGGGGDDGLSYDWGHLTRLAPHDEYFEIKNVGPFASTMITAVNPLPSHLTFATGSFPGGSGSTTINGQSKTFCTGSLSANGDSCIVLLRYNSSASGPVSSVMTVTYHNGSAFAQTQLGMDAYLYDGALLSLSPFYGGGGGNEESTIPTYDAGVQNQGSDSWHYFRLKNTGNTSALSVSLSPAFSAIGFDYQTWGVYPGGDPGTTDPQTGAVFCPANGNNVPAGTDCIIKMSIRAYNVEELTDVLSLVYTGGPKPSTMINIHVVNTDLGLPRFYDTFSGGWTGGDLDFGKASSAVGPQIKDIMIKNDGLSPMTVTGAAALPSGFTWASGGAFPGVGGGSWVYEGQASQLVSACGSLMNSGDRCLVRVAFNPSGTNFFQGDLVLNTTGTATPTVRRRMRGESTNAGVLVIRDDNVSIPTCSGNCPLYIGETFSQTYQSYLLMNVGGTAVTVEGEGSPSEPTVTGSAYISNYTTFDGAGSIMVRMVSTPTCGSGGTTFVLAPGASCAFQTTFYPSASPASSEHHATINIQSNVGLVTRHIWGRRTP